MIAQSCRATKSTKIALAMLGVCALLRTSGAAVLPSAISSPLDMPASVAYGNLPLHFEPSSTAGGGGEEFIAVASGRSFRIARDAVATELGRTASSPRAIALRFEGASATAAIAGETPLEGRSHYFRGANSGPPVPRALDVPHFAKVRVAGLYPGIDAVYHAHGRDLEFDLVVAPGADPRRIRMRFDGIDSASFDRSGDLQLRSGDERVRQQRPNIYQEIEGRHVQVSGRYVSLGRHRYGLRLGRFDRTRSLVIDPILSYSTALGGKASDAATAIAVDGAGNAYIAGWTTSSNFPSVNAYDSRLGNGDMDVFVAKLNATGTALLYSTFIGGAKGQDYATGIAIDPQGNAYVTGSTSGNDFPVTANAYRASPATGGGAFVAKLGPAGNALAYSTYLPFASNTRVAVDASGSAYVGGQATTGFATPAGAFQTSIQTVSDGAPFALKLNPGGTAAVYSTIVGGTGTDTFRGIAVDAVGNAYLAGSTTSNDFPVSNPLQSTRAGGMDGFVSKLNASGTALIYSTFLGGSLDETIYAIAVDPGGSAYVAGETYSTNFPVRNAFQPVKAGSHLVNSSLGNAFISKLASTGDALVYSSYLGGEICYPGYCQSVFGFPQFPGDAAYGIAVDNQGHALVMGVATSYTFPLIDSRVGQKQQDNEESLFVVKVGVTGNALVYSSLIHNGFDAYGPTVTRIPHNVGQAIATDINGNAYIALQDLGDFPTTPGAYQSTTVGGHSFVFKLSSGTASVGLMTSANPSLGGGSLTLTAAVTGGTPAGIVSFLDGGVTVGSAAVVNGNASLSLALPVGIRSLAAIYRDGASEADSPIYHQIVNPSNVCQ